MTEGHGLPYPLRLEAGAGDVRFLAGEDQGEVLALARLLSRPLKGQAVELPAVPGIQAVVLKGRPHVPVLPVRPEGQPDTAASVALAEAPAVHREHRPEILAEWMLGLGLAAPLLRHGVPVGLRGQLPLAAVGPHGLHIHPLEKVHHDALRAAVKGGDVPGLPLPGKPGVRRDGLSRPAAMAYEPAVEADPPRKLLRLLLELPVLPGVAEHAGVKARLQGVKIPVRLLHRSNALGAEGGEGCLPLRGGGILPEEGRELLLAPHPALLQGGGVAAGEKQPEEVRKVPGHGVDTVLGPVGGAHGQDHVSGLRCGAEVDAVHPGPAQDRCPHGGAEVSLPAGHKTDGGEVQPAAAKRLIGHGIVPLSFSPV